MAREPVRLAAAGVLLVAGGALAQGDGRAELRATLLEAADRGAVERALWAGLLREPTPEPRLQAVTVLAAAADPSSLPLLERWAADPEAAVRSQAMVAAGRIGAAAGGIARAGLDSASPAVRQAAAWAACHTGGEAAAALLERLPREGNVGVAETALANLWRLDGIAWEERASVFARSPEPRLRRALAYSLARRPRAEGRVLVRTLLRDPEPVVRATALKGLRDGDLTAADWGVVAASLDDPDARVRVEACRAVEAHPQPRLTEGAAAALRRMWTRVEPDPQAAVAAVEAAGAHPEAASAADLETLAADPAEPWLAATALAALARRGEGAAARIAADWLAGSDVPRRRAAAAAAATLPEAQAASLLDKVLGDQEPAVRLAWLEALTEDRAKGRVEALRRLVGSDPDPAVRSQALELLRGSGAAGTVDELLERARGFRDDRPGDARGTAYTVALALAAGDERQRVLEVALADPDPGVVTTVVNAARAAGLTVEAPAREPRHGRRWYAELASWGDEERFLDLVTVRGTVRVRLDPATAPITAREVWDLAQGGFYDGLTFHRVVPNFVVQGGDPRGDGWGGAGFVLPDEPSLEPFDAWRVGIATSGPNTGSCQLFFTLMPADHLTGHYTNLGEVVAGRDVLTRIRVGDRILRAKALTGAHPEPAPTLVGPLQWSDLATLAGWGEELDAYQPDPAAVERLRQATGAYRVEVVLGTWCGDSEREVPRLVRVVEEVGGDRFALLLHGVDRGKRVTDPAFPPGVLPDATAERVPTILVLDEAGLELGRVVETAEQPLEQLLVEMLSAAEGW